MRYFSSKDKNYVTAYMPFTLNNVTYPGAWWDKATEEDKQKLGLIKLVVTNEPADDRFYWVQEQLNEAALTYVNTPKDITLVKTIMSEQINQLVFQILSATDWKIIKALETGTALPVEFTEWRAAVRAVGNNAITNINKAIHVDEIAVIVNTLQWPLQK